VALLRAQSDFDGAQLLFSLPGEVEELDEGIDAQTWLHFVAWKIFVTSAGGDQELLIGHVTCRKAGGVGDAKLKDQRTNRHLHPSCNTRPIVARNSLERTRNHRKRHDYSASALVCVFTRACALTHVCVNTRVRVP